MTINFILQVPKMKDKLLIKKHVMFA
jgi:hypothetical protein